jgi:hypothetical protein
VGASVGVATGVRVGDNVVGTMLHVMYLYADEVPETTVQTFSFEGCKMAEVQAIADPEQLEPEYSHTYE